MNIIFMGTPDFSATVLEELVNQHTVCAVYTRPDAASARGTQLVASPVKRMAQRFNLPVHTQKSLRDPQVIAQIAAYEPDVICVAAYGAILPPEVLAIPRYGCINVHASLLPKWRGAAPIERSILAGDAETGVCVMRMEQGLDTGDYCVCRTIAIENKGAQELTDELANLGAYALLTALIHVESGAVDWTQQDGSQATYAEKIGKRELFLDPAATAPANARRVQASSAAHAARCIIAGRATSVLAACVPTDAVGAQQAADMVAGQVCFFAKRLFLGCEDGAIEVQEVQPDGKQAMAGKAFAAGVHTIKSGTLTWEKLDG
ncbi:MAG: methionyl-tRNA formyltransferase [Raoultibacter sp.]